MGMKQPFISEIAPDTYAINEFGLAAMYLCVGSERAVLIDTGCGVCNLKEIVETLTDKPYDVVLTHGHLDHIGGCGAFETIHIHEKDVALAHSLSFEELRHYCDSLGNMGAYQAYDFSRDMVKEFSTFPKMLPIQEGQIFDLGDRELEVFEIPGHTEGSCALLDRKNRILFSGDCANINTLGVSGSVHTLLKGFLKVKALQPYYDQNWNGHIGYAGEANCFSQPKSVPDDLIAICKQILRGEGNPKQTIFLGREMTAIEYGKVRLVYQPERILDEGETPVSLDCSE